MNIKDYDDNIENALDYDKLCDLITKHVENNSFALIETVAESVANLIKTNFKVENITVSVSKPNAVLNAGNIQIKIKR